MMRRLRKKLKRRWRLGPSSIRFYAKLSVATLFLILKNPFLLKVIRGRISSMDWLGQSLFWKKVKRQGIFWEGGGGKKKPPRRPRRPRPPPHPLPPLPL